MGRVLQAGFWCRDRACRGGARAEHFPGDGCSCHANVEAPEAPAEEAPEPEVSAAEAPPRLTRLTAKAARLSAFACRMCRRQAQVMVEYPDLFFRCESCAGGLKGGQGWS